MISIIDWLIRLSFRTLFIFKSFDFVPCQEKKECNRFPQRNLNKTKVSDVRFTSARSIVHCSRSRRRQLWGCWKTWRPKHVVYSIWLLRVCVAPLLDPPIFHFKRSHPPPNFALTGARTYVFVCICGLYTFSAGIPSTHSLRPSYFPPGAQRQHNCAPGLAWEDGGGVYMARNKAPRLHSTVDGGAVNYFV
jgi:hypothetical protein